MAFAAKQAIPKKISTKFRSGVVNSRHRLTTKEQKLGMDTKASYDEENYLFFCIVGTKTRKKTKVGVGIFLWRFVGVKEPLGSFLSQC
jgi:hypothetical protein